MDEDIRWEQRFSNYLKALNKLSKAVVYINENEISKGATNVLEGIIIEGLIQRFEYTHELAWNVMKDYAHFQGNPNVAGSRDASREAFQLQLVEDGKVWMDMIASRNKTSHTYNEITAEEIFNKILKEYYPAFMAFKTTMENKLI